jgi:hypothetical protein
MTRRDAAVLVFVCAGLYFLLVSLSYLSGLVWLFNPPVVLPPGWNPVVYFASHLVPFGLLLAAGQVLIRGRHGFAQELFGDDSAPPQPDGEAGQVRLFGSLAFTVLGLLAFLSAIDQLPAVIQILRPYSWHSASPVRVVLVSVFHPLLLVAYIVLGWYLVVRRESLVGRWLLPPQQASEHDQPPRTTVESMVFRVVGLWFMMVAIRPLSDALVNLLARGFSGTPSKVWDSWPEATRGTLELLFGIVVFLGKSGMASAWRRFGGLRTA